MPIISAPSAIAIIIALFALLVAYRNYTRKSGIDVRGSYTICSSLDCEDTYVSSLILENQKDRALTIFAIYLQVGYNYYITLDDLEDRPVILSPYQTMRLEYGPIEMYSASMTRVKINELIKNPKVRHRLVLSTPSGRYNVPTRIRKWSPVGLSFSNYLTGVLQPIRNRYEGDDVGGNIRYIVHFTHVEGKDEVVHLLPDDYRRKRFKSFQLTEASLASKEALEMFLNKVKLDAKATFDFKVHDLTPWRERTLGLYASSDPHIGKPVSWFAYFVVGRLMTFLEDRKLRKARTQTQKVPAPVQIALVPEKPRQEAPNRLSAAP